MYFHSTLEVHFRSHGALGGQRGCFLGTNEGFSLEDAEEQKWMWKYGWIFEDQVVDKNEDCGGRLPRLKAQ